MEIRVDIDTRELADDGAFCDIVGDIAADVIRDSGEVEHIVTSTIENDIGYHISTYLEDSPVLDPDNEHFINAVAKAILNMARSYVGE
tara:strand:+ start:124 stop:387 length:264 start_codon:yes stop_codon:yes gene_type:complete